MDILILVAAVLLIGLFCYKNVPTLIGGIVCSVILMIIYKMNIVDGLFDTCLLYTSPSPRDRQKSRMPSSA